MNDITDIYLIIRNQDKEVVAAFISEENAEGELKILNGKHFRLYRQLDAFRLQRQSIWDQ